MPAKAGNFTAVLSVLGMHCVSNNPIKFVLAYASSELTCCLRRRAMVVVDVIIAKSSVLSSVEIKSGSEASFYHETASAEPEAQIPFSKRESSRKKMSHLDARDSPQSVATFNWQYRWFRQTLLTGEFVS